MCVQVFGVDFLYMNVIAIQIVRNFQMLTRLIQFMTNFISISNIIVHSAFKSRALDYNTTHEIVAFGKRNSNDQR